MQQQNETQAPAEEQTPGYANTLGFRIIQQCDTTDMPDDVKGEIKEIMAKLSEVNPDDVESAVVVLRVKAQGPEGQPGFGLIVAAVGAQDLVMGSSLMLNEHLVQGMGGPGAMLAQVLGGLAGPGCGDPNCEECGKGCEEAPSGLAGIKVVVDNTVTGDPKEVAAAVEASCNGVGVTKH